MELSGIFMAEDKRPGLSPQERISGPVHLTTMGPPHDVLVVAFPFTNSGRELPIPDEEDAEILKVSEAGDFGRYITASGEVVFRKVTREDIPALSALHPDVAFPELETDDALAAMLGENFFLPPA